MSESTPRKNAPVPLDAPERTQPIHPSLPSVKLPTIPASADEGVKSDTYRNVTHPSQLHPVTLKPLSIEDLKANDFHTLREQYSTREAALKARDDAVKELKALKSNFLQEWAVIHGHPVSMRKAKAYQKWFNEAMTFTMPKEAPSD